MPNKTLTDSGAGLVQFEDDLRSAAQTVRSALAHTLTAVGADVSQPRSMAKRFGLDKTLAWKLSRVVSEDNLATLVDHLPGRAGLDIAIRSLEDAGAMSHSVAALRHAIAEFDRTVELHCGDRDTLELMLGHLHREGRQQREEAHRKRAFQGNRAVWGVQARLQVCLHFVAPNAADPSMLDTALISGLVDLRRLRQDTVWPVATLRQYADDGSPLPPHVVEPLDSRIKAGGGLPALADFSSSPLPPMRELPGTFGRTTYVITEGPVGNTAAITCLTGVMSRARFSRYRSEHDAFGGHAAGMSTPVECLLHDVYLHRDFAATVSPELAVYSQLHNEPTYPAGGYERGRLQMNESIIDLGDAPVDVVTPEFPRYRELCDLAFSRLGWTVRDFHGYRHRLRYPPLSCVDAFRYTLPERPSAPK